MLAYVIVALVSFLLCTAITWFIRDLAFRYGYVSSPSSDRHVHRIPVPRLGGIAIFASVAAVCLLRALYFHHGERLTADVNFLRLLAVLAAGAIVFAVGLLDDLRPVRPYSKIFAQVISAIIFFFSGPRLLHIHSLFGSAHLGTLLSLLATIAWIVLVSNAFNLIDGLDGLAGGSALCSTATLFIVSLFTAHHVISLITSSLAGAILGFLVFNFSPASIFLGDCGSLFLGVLLAESCLTLQDETPVVLGIFLPLCCFALPLLDTALAIFRRFLNGRPVFSADGEHIHHKLLERGLSQRQAVVLLCAGSALCSCVIAVLLRVNGLSRNFFICAVGAAIVTALVQLRYREFHELHCIVKRIATQRQVVRNDLVLRRATERLLCELSIQGVCHVLMAAFEKISFDGFTLQLKDLPQGASELFSRTEKGHFAFGWRKSEQHDAMSAATDWRLHLELQNRGESVGALTVHRCSVSGPLLLDLDILSNDFRRALSLAVERSFLSPSPALTAQEKSRLLGPEPQGRSQPARQYRFSSSRYYPKPHG